MIRIFSFVLLLGWFASAQDVSITAGADQTNPRKLVIQVTGLTSAQFDSFFGDSGPGNSVSAYKFYVITHPDEPEVQAIDRTGVYIDPTQRIQAGLGIVTLPLLQSLLAARDQTYIVVINGLGGKGRVMSKIDSKASLLSPDPTRVANEIKISSSVPLSNQQGSAVEVDRKRITLKSGQPTMAPEKISARITRVDSDGLVLDLSKSLAVGTNTVSVIGLTDLAGNSVSAQGKVDVPSAPANESDAYVLAKVGANAAVHQAPIFTFTGNIAPLHPAIRSVFWGPFRFDPSVTADVGLRSTKSANSITLPAPFTKMFIFGLPTPNNGDQPQRFTKVNPYAMQFAFGPRFETDRDFKRLNTLGEARWEIYTPWLSRDLTGRKARLSAAHPEIRDFLELPTRGFSFAPYFQFDGGGHVNDETVTNSKTKQSVVVPNHSIARAYVGIKGSIQAWLVSVDLDSSYLNMLDRETIGFTTTTQALLRRVEGWHPHSKASFSLFFNQAKHLAFTVTYENGRSAPNFEYLNKVDVGFKIIY